MRTLRTAVGALALCCALATPAFAGKYVKLKGGGYVKGQAVSYDEATETLTFEMEAGGTRAFKMSELDGRSVYLVNRSRVPKDDATRQIRAGNFARDVGLYAHAARHYGYASKADPAREPEIERERALLRELAADWGMQQARDAIAEEDIREAEKWLVRVVEKLPDEPQAQEARAMLDRYYAGQRAEREAEAQAKAGEALKKDLARGKKHYDDMVAKTHKGLTAKRTGNAAVSAWEGALKDGGRVQKELDRLEKKYGEDAATVEQLQEYRLVVTEQMVEIHLHLASLWTVRSSYDKALNAANQALALDPKSTKALSARARIEQAAAERRWDW